MFDAFESIEEGYLWNFSPIERLKFETQHRQRQVSLMKYQGKLAELAATNSPAIFGNDEPHPNTTLEIKYTFNRLRLNDTRETELLLNHIDPPSGKNNSYARKIVWAFEDNTYCDTVILNGVRIRDGWFTRGFNDREAGQILGALADKKLKEFSFMHYPLLTDKTYRRIADIVNRPDNRWEKVELGQITLADDIADAYTKSGKVSFEKVARQKRRLFSLSRLWGRERS